MTKRSKKTVPEDVPEEVVVEDNDAGTSNDLDEIETSPETAPEPTEVVSNGGDVPSNKDVMLPRSASRYIVPLR